MRIPWNNVPLLDWAKAHQRHTVALIREMVEIESPSGDAAALHRFADWFERHARTLGADVRRAPGGHLLCEFGSAGAGSRVLALGHYDTVWPSGTLQAMPWREENGRLWGPGVLDMKGGIAFFLTAVTALRELGIGLPTPVLLQLNADEETGSHTSRELTELNARSSSAVLVLEPGAGLSGKLKTARKGVGEYRLTVKGRASHAGVDFAAGASAVIELARQLLKIAEFTSLEHGITVNPGVIAGGTRSNVVAAEASARIDVRVANLHDAHVVDRKFHALEPVDKHCTLAVEGGLNRPPMERSEGVAALFRNAQALGRGIGVHVEESPTGGGSDGNFTAALGVPTLDGLGGVGEGAHAVNESILVERIADRVALLAMLMAEVGA
jgi:glutamate carboxypeptidase